MNFPFFHVDAFADQPLNGNPADEDPVTGSAHYSLGPYWSEILGKTELLAYQASARGGVLKVSVKERNVLIAGKAITVIAGEYRI
jgi:predicted PhzF superfamily epimerase YddE/YHI9